MGLDSVLVITDKIDENLMLASRNLPNVLVVEARERRSGQPGALQQGAGHRGAVAKIEEMFA